MMFSTLSAACSSAPPDQQFLYFFTGKQRFCGEKGILEEMVRLISAWKANEPQWDKFAKFSSEDKELMH
jgi:hypothetical protein